MNRQQRRAQAAWERNNPLTIILPHDISDEGKADLKREAKSIGAKRVRFVIEQSDQ